MSEQLPDAIDLTAAAQHIVTLANDDEADPLVYDALVQMWCDLIGMRNYPRLGVEIARALVERDAALRAFVPPFTYSDLEG